MYVVLLVGQTYGTAAEALYWWYSSWNDRRIFAGILREMGWNCGLCCYERSSKWKVYIFVIAQHSNHSTSFVAYVMLYEHNCTVF